jgi:hypothetical protein
MISTRYSRGFSAGDLTQQGLHHILGKARPKQKALPSEAPLQFWVSIGGRPAGPSIRIVHVEFDRVWGHFEAFDFSHLQFDKTVDEVVVEPAAGLRKPRSLSRFSSASRSAVSVLGGKAD